jgi:hypothetical protein
MSWSSVRRSQRTARRLNCWSRAKGLLDDVAELAQALDVRGVLREITGRIRRLRSSRRLGSES